MTKQFRNFCLNTPRTKADSSPTPEIFFRSLNERTTQNLRANLSSQVNNQTQMNGDAMERCSMQEGIGMRLWNNPDVMTLTSTQNKSEISLESPLIHDGALTALVHSEEHNVSQMSLQRHGALNLLSGYAHPLILPGVTEEEVWNTVVGVADHTTKIREFTNVRDSATNSAADFRCCKL